jgi:hypothetical protein
MRKITILMAGAVFVALAGVGCSSTESVPEQGADARPVGSTSSVYHAKNWGPHFADVSEETNAGLRHVSIDRMLHTASFPLVISPTGILGYLHLHELHVSLDRILFGIDCYDEFEQHEIVYTARR